MASGHVCGRPALPNLQDIPQHFQVCRQHAAQYRRRYEHAGNIHHQEGRCTHFLATNRWCRNNAVEGGRLCGIHQAALQQRLDREAQAQARELQIRTLHNEFAQRNPLPSWRDVAQELFQRNELPMGIRKSVSLRYYFDIRVPHVGEDAPWDTNRPSWRFIVYWNWLMNGANPANPPDLVNLPQPIVPPVVIPPIDPNNLGGQAPLAPRAADRRLNELERIAADRQNVHTTAVTRQTNEIEKKLLEVVVPQDQQTEHTIACEWLFLSTQLRWGEMLRTMVDIHKWFNARTCRQTNDNLYKNLLRGVVAKINNSETEEMKIELFKRLQEECVEAVGMCCEGHISRLCNVFVGFDDAFKSPVSIGELIQEKMAAIASSDLPVEERLSQARAWFDEYGVPEADRASWLLAIETM